jgi:nucleoid-associated protein YgaU
METKLKQILKTVKLNENTISMVLGALVVIVTGILVVNYFKEKGGDTLPDLSTQTDQSQYIVKEGETLWSISEDRYGSGYNWVDIYEANNLTSESIAVGQILTLPDVSAEQPTDTKEVSEVAVEATEAPEASPTASSQPEEISGDTYTVVKGDSLWSISEAAYGNGYRWTEIAKVNKLDNPNVIHTGNVLTLPR